MRNNNQGFKIEPRIDCYLVEKGVWDGKYRIMKDSCYIKTNAVLADNPWETIEPFDSWIRAHDWLKKHVHELL